MSKCVLIKGFKFKRSLSLSFCLFDVRVRSLLSQYINLDSYKARMDHSKQDNLKSRTTCTRIKI